MYSEMRAREEFMDIFYMSGATELQFIVVDHSSSLNFSTRLNIQILSAKHATCIFFYCDDAIN